MSRAVLLAGALLVSCGGGGLHPPGDQRLASGTWGGEDVGVIVGPAGVHVHIGCTFGDIEGEVPLDEEGRFTVDGTYVLRAFPVVTGPALPAQFSGRVQGRVLRLAVAVHDTVEQRIVALGPVSVVRGGEPELGTCPICRGPRR